MNNISSADFERVQIKDDHDSIKIITGRFSGTIVTYNYVQLTEPSDESSDAILSFTYDVEYSENDVNDLGSNDFTTYLGELIEYILWASIEEKNFKIGNMNASNSDTAKSTR